ncbi:MAG: DNA polymerase III subunit delta, partial [Pseudobdellovibrionaceae bacterium]
VGVLSQELFAAPFLAEKRLVLIKNILSLTKNAPVQKEVLEILRNRPLPDSTIAVFWDREDEVKGKTAAHDLWEILKVEKYRESFPLLETGEAISFFTKECSAKQITLDRDCASLAIACLGTDSWALSLLADQLSAWKPNSIVGVQDLSQFVTAPGDNNIFNLVDAIIQGKIAAALTMMRAQYAIGEDDQFIFQMLIRQARIMVLLADCLSHGDSSPDTIAKKLGLHPFVVKKTIPLVRTFTLDELKNLYQQLVSFDQKVKSGRGDLSVLLDGLTVSLGSRKK